MHRTQSFVVTLALTLFASTAHAGIVAGTLWINAKAASRGAEFSLPRAQRGITEAVVYLETVPEKVERKLANPGAGWFRKPAKPRIPRIVQNKHVFTPRVLSIPAGTDVEFLNMDRVYHNAFSVSPARRFDIGKYAPGKADTVRFTKTGTVNLHCDIHPTELGYVIVMPNHAFARPDSLGRFALPKLPPGRYTVRAVHPRLGEVHRTVDVPRRGDVALSLSF